MYTSRKYIHDLDTDLFNIHNLLMSLSVYKLT